jgi:Spy/CpxP family protein refolding chaperone
METTMTSTIAKYTATLALGLGLSLGAGRVARAQSAGQPTTAGAPQGEDRDGPGRGGRERGRRGGPDAMLLKGITLTADQQTRFEALRQSWRKEMEARSEQMRGSADDLRAARQRGDTAALRQARAQWEQGRERHVAAIRELLTADQRRQLNANLAEMRQRAASRDSLRQNGGSERGGWDNHPPQGR